MKIPQIITNKRAEAYIGTGVKIIISVVIGLLVLGGLYLIIAGEGGIMDSMNNEIQDMMGYTQELRVERAVDENTGCYYLRYSYDGKHWQKASIPTYSETATVYSLISNRSESNQIDVAVIQDEKQYYVLTSPDGGITWEEEVSFQATLITHCYFGTSSQLPSTSGSFSGEKFVIRYKNGNYYTMVSDGITWVKPTWSDLIPIY